MGELSTALRHQERRQDKVESEDEMKKRGLPSPDVADVADAIVLTFAEAGRGRQKVRHTQKASWRVT